MINLNFKMFFESEKNGDLKKLLKKIPSSHKELVKDFKFKYTKNNTINSKNKHIGVIHKDKIEVAAPWNYGREFTTLHEIAHMVWSYKMTNKLKKEWSNIVKKTKNKPKDTDEELFCHSYAQYYAKNKLLKFDIPEWNKFISKKIPA
jgi:hypothetical protein